MRFSEVCMKTKTRSRLTWSLVALFAAAIVALLVSIARDNRVPLWELEEQGKIQPTHVTWVDMKGSEPPAWQRTPLYSDGWELRMLPLLLPEGGSSQYTRRLVVYKHLGKQRMSDSISGLAYREYKITDPPTQRAFAQLAREHAARYHELGYSFVFEQPDLIPIIPSKSEETPTYKGHIGISGTYFSKMPEGDWDCLLEQAVVIVRVRNNQFRLYDLAERQVEGTTTRFQTLDVDQRCGATLPNFVDLPYRCVRSEEWKTWPEIKGFLKGEMSSSSHADMVGSVEDYLHKEGVL
jgi:hypothetical protein